MKSISKQSENAKILTQKYAHQPSRPLPTTLPPIKDYGSLVGKFQTINQGEEGYSIHGDPHAEFKGTLARGLNQDEESHSNQGNPHADF